MGPSTRQMSLRPRRVDGVRSDAISGRKAATGTWRGSDGRRSR